LSAGVAGLVLAAGASSRLEGAMKLLLPFGDGALVAAPVRSALAAGLDPVIVVVGHRGSEVAGALRGLAEEGTGRVRIVTVAEPGRGQGASLAAGIEALRGEPEVEAAAVLLGDEPGVRPEDIRRVVAAWRRGGAPVVRARYRDRPGHPVLFDRSWFSRLAGVEGDVGAGPLLASRPADVSELRLPGEAPVDVDTEADYRLAAARAGVDVPAEGAL
jgi:molybdenum cofactor cytidylyltransferase